MKPVEPGAQIHSSDPFATPEAERSATRRLRGRLIAPVTLWTTAGPAGLTVSSTMVAEGEPGRVLGLIDEESGFFDAVTRSGRFAVIPLGPDDQQRADRFAGLMPAPGGPFATGEWDPTPYGPVPVGAPTWAGCRIEDDRECGWARLVTGVIESVVLDPSPVTLGYFRGRYRRLAQ